MALRHRIAALGSAALIASLGVVGLGAAGAASAAVAAACNSYAATLAGQGMECTVTVDNYVNGVDEYSTVTIKECHGAAYTVLLAPACITTVIINPELTVSVTQCNGTLNGGGSNVTCSVRVNNNFSGPATPAFTTLNQCVGSGAGGTSPVGDPLNCAPPGLTIGATVTQCNGSVNGGGAPQRVNCDVPIGSETALPFLIDQCNGTVNGGGSVLFCHAEFTNTYNVVGLPAPPAGSSTTVTPSTTGGTFGTPGGPTFAPPAVGGVVVAAAPTAAQLALSGNDSTPMLLTALLLITLGAGAIAVGGRRIRRPAHRMG
jgi:hypothetical protein